MFPIYSPLCDVIAIDSQVDSALLHALTNSAVIFQLCSVLRI